MSTALQFFVGGRLITPLVDSARWSSVDPGGFETASISLAGGLSVAPGERVTIMHGLSTVWMGRVEAPGEDDAGATRSSIEAVGPGAALSDNTMREIYVDRDLSKWQPPAIARQVIYGEVRNGSPNVGTSLTDSATSAVEVSLTGAWGSPAAAEAWYNAQGIPLALMYAAWDRGAGDILPTDPNWQWAIYLLTDETASIAFLGTANLRAAGPGTNYLTDSGRGDLKYALIQLRYTAAGGAQGTKYLLRWTNLAVYGTHGLTGRGGDPVGFWASDIAKHAVRKVPGIAIGPVGDDSAYVVPHAVYSSPVPHAEVVDDMCKLLGWHWGVWEPYDGEETPRFWFTAPPAEATHYVRRADCQGYEPQSARLSSLYNRAEVTFTTAAGVTQVVTVTNWLPQLGDQVRTLSLNFGTSTAAAASAFGMQALKLSQASARGGGQVTLPPDVKTPTGFEPSMLLRPGRHRLRVSDLPNAGSWTEGDTRRYDTFRVRRVETTMEGVVSATTAELDGGADLLEVIQARLALANVVAGG